MADQPTDATDSPFTEEEMRLFWSRESFHTADNILPRLRGILMGAGMNSDEADGVIRTMVKHKLIAPPGYDAPNVIRKALSYQPLSPQDSDHPVTLEELVFTTLGQTSMCWKPGPGDAVFDSVRASEIGNELVRCLRARGAS